MVAWTSDGDVQDTSSRPKYSHPHTLSPKSVQTSKNTFQSLLAENKVTCGSQADACWSPGNQWQAVFFSLFPLKMWDHETFKYWESLQSVLAHFEICHSSHRASKSVQQFLQSTCSSLSIRTHRHQMDARNFIAYCANKINVTHRLALVQNNTKVLKLCDIKKGSLQKKKKKICEHVNVQNPQKLMMIIRTVTRLLTPLAQGGQNWPE